jgi:hypothetical protein
MKTAVTLFISILLVIAIQGRGAAQNAGERSSFRWNNISLRVSLDSLMKWYSESIVYLDKDIEGKEVSVSCTSCSFDEALNAILSGTSLEWIRRGNQIILKEQGTQQTSRHITISGTITDSITGEWIVGASALLQDSADQVYKTVRRWCPTNAFGFFSLPRVPCGRYTFVIRALGYETLKWNIDSLTGESLRLYFGMVQKDIMVKEVTIEGHRTALTSAGGFSRGAYHRSVPTDQNQYLLDGGRIYNPAHFGGVLSTFSSEALNDVQVMLGGLPPSYGGRIGGIVDLSMRDGSRQRFSGSLGLGSLGSSLSVEGPFTNNTTFIISSRRGYPDIAMRIFSPSGVKPSSLGFSELIAKITHRFSGSNQISVSGYLGSDSYVNDVEGEGEKLDNDFSWGNRMLDIRWIGIVTPSLFLHTSIVYSRYDFDLQHILKENSLPYSGTQLSSNYAIEDFSLCANAEGYYNEDHTIRAGVELTHHRMNGYISEFSNQTATLSMQNISSWEAAIYLQDQWKILPRVAAELGGRITSFTSDQGSFSAIDPRFSLLISMSEQTRLYSSLFVVNQFIHPYRKSGVFLLYPAIFWYPSTEKMRPSTSLQITLGMERSLNNDAFIMSAESYYRITNNLHEFGIDTTAALVKNLENMILLGTGKTYGFTCSLKKRTGALTGAITYNLSWSLESFADINEGREFIPPFDRRHELQITSSYSIDNKWIFSGLCIITSGYSSTIVPKITQSKAVDGRPNVGGGEYAVGANLASNEFIDVNGCRLPGFQRLEFNLTRNFFISNLPCQFSLRLMNGYGLLDPFVWKLQQSSIVGLKWNATLQEQSLFPLYPALDFTVRF